MNNPKYSEKDVEEYKDKFHWFQENLPKTFSGFELNGKMVLKIVRLKKGGRSLKEFGKMAT